MDSRNISLLTHQNTMQIHCGYVLRDGGGESPSNARQDFSLSLY